jgi:PAS domain S-box-containing protein
MSKADTNVDLERRLKNAESEIARLRAEISAREQVYQGALGQAKAARRESEELYRGLIENSGLGIFLTKVGGGLLFVNNSFAGLLGYEAAEEIYPIPSHHIIAPHDRNLDIRFGKEAADFAEGKSKQYECEFVHKDGSYIPFLVVLRKIKWDGQDVIQRTLIDVTERKQAENAQRESEDRLRAIIDNSPSPMYLKDLDSRILLINKAYEHQYGVTQDTAFGAQGHEWLGREKFEKLRSLDQAIIASGQSSVSETEEQTDSGEIVTTQSIKFPVRDNAGQIVAIGGIASDVTERRWTEKSLAQKSALLQTTLDHIVEGITVFDADLKLIAFNQVFIDLYKFPPGFIRLGLSYEKMARYMAESGHYGAGDVEEQVRSRVSRMLSGGPRRFERTGEDGVTVELWRTPLPGGGAVNTYTDVSERKRAAEALQRAKLEAEAAAERAHEANAAKSKFLAVMSHEIRTPMNGVLGMADLLIQTALTEQQHDFVETIRESGGALLGLLNDILDLSKIEAGRVELEEVNFSITEMLAATNALWTHPAREKGLAFSIHNNLTDIDVVRSDHNRIRQILNNLIGNAIKFTSDGKIEVHVSAQHRDEEGIELRFEISDTGIGVSEEAKENLFQPFTQADSSTTRQYGGTGLGLTISKNLAELLGGEIGLESVQGKGSVFWFTVPMERASPETLTPTSVPGESGLSYETFDGQAMRILIAEDNSINQKVVSWLLAPLNCQFDIVENGLEAVAAVARSHYDVVLMDVQMPEMDGITATKQIRSLNGTDGQVPIIAMTANAMQGDREKYLEAGMNDYIPKPIDQRDLLNAITRIAGNPLPNIEDAAEPEAMIGDELNETTSTESPEELNDLMSALDNLLNGTNH